jgi:hypothetical protein
MANTPRGSLPMYFPTAPFALADIPSCTYLLDIAYDQYTQWYNQDYPSRNGFIWKLPTDNYAYSGPLYWTYTWWDGVSYDEPFGFLALDDANGAAYLVFRGTMSDADDVQDALWNQTAYTLAPNYGQVHVGFFQIYQKLQADVHAVINALNRASPLKRFLFTGHSLGSALSSLAVGDVLANTAIKPGAISLMHYNLASPRVGDPQFAYSMNNNGVPTYRIVNTEDIVPDGPTAIFTSYVYKHIGTPVDFTANYGTIGFNHSLDVAYEYAISHPNNPEAPLLQGQGPRLRLAARPGVRVAVEGRLRRLPRAQRAAAAPT